MAGWLLAGRSMLAVVVVDLLLERREMVAVLFGGFLAPVGQAAGPMAQELADLRMGWRVAGPGQLQ